jgi:hypothetical protein
MKWLKKFLSEKKSPELLPEANWHISVDDTSFTVRDAQGAVAHLNMGDLSGVAIETNDTGPSGADLWWLLFGADDRVAIAFPGGATGEKSVVDWLMKLPNFDYGQMIQAMSSTRVAVFPLWRKMPSSQI